MPEQKVPSIGRIVHYRVPSTLQHNHAEILPAIVVCVWSDECVNLKVLCDGPEDALGDKCVVGGRRGVLVLAAPPKQ